jgi:hypothetical protein
VDPKTGHSDSDPEGGVLDEPDSAKPAKRSSHTGPPDWTAFQPMYVDWRACTATPLTGLADYKVRLKLPPLNLPSHQKRYFYISSFSFSNFCFSIFNVPRSLQKPFWNVAVSEKCKKIYVLVSFIAVGSRSQDSQIKADLC